jgi:hypothetical protein
MLKNALLQYIFIFKILLPFFAMKSPVCYVLRRGKVNADFPLLSQLEVGLLITRSFHVSLQYSSQPKGNIGNQS